MSGAEVFIAVGAIVTGFTTCVELCKKWRRKRKAKKAEKLAMQSEKEISQEEEKRLEVVMHRGATGVQQVWDRDFARLGTQFTRGDEIGRSALWQRFAFLVAKVATALAHDESATTDSVRRKMADLISFSNVVHAGSINDLAQQFQRMSQAAPIPHLPLIKRSQLSQAESQRLKKAQAKLAEVVLAQEKSKSILQQQIAKPTSMQPPTTSPTSTQVAHLPQTPSYFMPTSSNKRTAQTAQAAPTASFTTISSNFQPAPLTNPIAQFFTDTSPQGLVGVPARVTQAQHGSQPFVSGQIQNPVRAPQAVPVPVFQRPATALQTVPKPFFQGPTQPTQAVPTPVVQRPATAPQAMSGLFVQRPAPAPQAVPTQITQEPATVLQVMPGTFVQQPGNTHATHHLSNPHSIEQIQRPVTAPQASPTLPVQHGPQAMKRIPKMEDTRVPLLRLCPGSLFRVDPLDTSLGRVLRCTLCNWTGNNPKAGAGDNALYDTHLPFCSGTYFCPVDFVLRGEVVTAKSSDQILQHLREHGRQGWTVNPLQKSNPERFSMLVKPHGPNGAADFNA